jgi:hypothetical protein
MPPHRSQLIGEIGINRCYFSEFASLDEPQLLCLRDHRRNAVAFVNGLFPQGVLVVGRFAHSRHLSLRMDSDSRRHVPARYPDETRKKEVCLGNARPSWVTVPGAVAKLVFAAVDAFLVRQEVRRFHKVWVPRGPGRLTSLAGVWGLPATENELSHALPSLRGMAVALRSPERGRRKRLRDGYLRMFSRTDVSLGICSRGK